MRWTGTVLAVVMLGVVAGGVIAETATATAASGRVQGKGFTFVGPAGWKFSKPFNPHAAGLFSSPEVKDGIKQATILVDSTSAGKNDVASLAAIYAKNTGGKVAEGEVKLDGVVARRIVVEKRGKSFPEIAELLLAVKDSTLYIVQGSAVEGKDISHQIEEIRAGWKWE